MIPHRLVRHIRRRAFAPALALLLLPACASTPKVILQDGIALEQDGRFEEAIKYYNTLLTSGEATQEAVSPRLQAATEALAARKADEGQRALSNGQLELALSRAAEAYALAPRQPRVKALLRAVSDVQLERASNLVEQKKTLEALQVLSRLLEVWPEAAAARETRDELLREYTGRLEASSRTYDQQGLAANAFLTWVALQALQPGDAAIAAEVRRRREDLVRRYQVPLTWEVAGRGGLHQAASGALVDLRVKNPFLTLQAGPRVNEGLHLVLSRVDESFTQQVEPTAGVKAVPSGTRMVANPDRQKLAEEAARIEKEVLEVGERIDMLNAQLPRIRNAQDKNRITADVSRLEREHHRLSEEYVAALEKAERAPGQVEIVDYRDVRFPVERYRRAAVITFHLQALSSRADMPLKVDLDLSGRAEVSDEVHAAYPEYAIAARSLQFPKSDVVLRRDALADMARVVGETTDTLMNDILVLELRKGRELAKAGRIDEAAECYVRILLGTTGSPAPEVVELLRARGIADAALVRGERAEAEARATQ